MRAVFARDALAHKIDDVLRGCAGKKYFRNACLLEAGNIRFRNRAAQQHGDVVHPFLLEQIHQLRRQRVVSARKNGKSDDVDVFLNGGGCDHFRRLAQPGVDDFHPGIAQARAIIFAPRSWPSRPGFAISTRILFSGISLCPL